MVHNGQMLWKLATKWRLSQSALSTWTRSQRRHGARIRECSWLLQTRHNGSTVAGGPQRPLRKQVFTRNYVGRVQQLLWPSGTPAPSPAYNVGFSWRYLPPAASVGLLAPRKLVDWLHQVKALGLANLRDLGLRELRFPSAGKLLPPQLWPKQLTPCVAVLNAVNTSGYRVPGLLALLMAQALSPDRAYGLTVTDGVSAAHLALQHPPQQQQHWLLVDVRQLRGLWEQLLSDAASILGMSMRAVQLVLLFAPVAALAPLVALGYGEEAWYELLRSTLERSGPAFIKWGQWAATRHDLFSPAMCAQLEKLHVAAPSHPPEFTAAAIEATFGAPVAQLFDEFVEEPLASGSIGQVHLARLSGEAAQAAGYSSGCKVAVKVRHPGVGEAMQRDFMLMMNLARLIACLPGFRKLRVEETLAQFAAPMKEQIDLALEAQYLWRFNHNFRKEENVNFPRPVYPWVSKEVLVETYEAGQNVSRYLGKDSLDEETREAVAELGTNCMLKMVLEDNFIHSDLHPGNILLRFKLPDGWLLGRCLSLARAWAPNLAEELFKRWQTPEIVLLDVGMVTQLSPRDRTCFMGLFKSMTEWDGAGCARWALAFAGEQQTCRSPDAFVAASEQHFAALRGSSWDDSDFRDSSEAMATVLELVRLHEVSLPGHICAVLVTTLVLEGWSSRLAPEHSVLAAVKRLTHRPQFSWSGFAQERVDQVVESFMSSFEGLFQSS